MKLKKIVLFFFLLTLFHVSEAQQDVSKEKKFTRADSLRGTLSALRSCYDVKRYDLDVKVDIDNKFISGNNSIKFVATSDLQKLQIDLFENMKIEKIEWNAQQLSYTREFNAVFISFPELIKNGSAQSIKIYYSGNPQVAKHAPWDGGFCWSKDKKGDPFVGVACQGTGASLWWPCKDHQSDEPEEMGISVTVPKGLMDVSNGRLKSETDMMNGFTKYEWFVSKPINSYDVTLNIAKYSHFKENYINPVLKDTLTLDFYVLKENLQKAKKQFEQVKPMMNCFYTYFGEYPFVKDGYKLVEAPYLGMEHQSCVAYGNNYQNGYLGYDRSLTGYNFDFIIIHESAHEWWGNAITSNDIADMWIHEGFATYAEALYIECLYGHDAYLRYINSEKIYVRNDRPVIGPYGVNEEGSGDMYAKGTLLLHTIRNIMDDDKKFMEIIKGIQSTFRYTTVNSEQIEKYISEKSGIDLSPVFRQYLNNASIPAMEVQLSQKNSDVLVKYRWVTPTNKDLVMPVKISANKDKFELLLPSFEWKTVFVKDAKVDDCKVRDDLFYINVQLTK